MTFKKEYAKYYELFNNTKNYDAEVDFLEVVFKRYGNIKDVLDLGCGTGIHAGNLAKRGYNVSGIDLSSDMIELAKEKNIPNSDFHVASMADFNLEGQKFDATLIMFAALGYLTKNEELESCFKTIHEHLKDDGLLVLDVWNGLGVMNDLPSVRTKEVETQGYNIKRKSNPTLYPANHTCNVRFDVEIKKDGKDIDKYEEDHLVRFFFPQEIRKYIEDAGFEILQISKLFELDKVPDHKDWNISIVARKKG